MAVGRIVTTTYRYKRPPRKRKAVALEAPAIVRKRGSPDAVVPPDRGEESTPGNDSRPQASASVDAPPKSAIVTARRPGKQFADVPDTPPEELQRRGDAAEALWRELMRRARSA